MTGIAGGFESGASSDVGNWEWDLVNDSFWLSDEAYSIIRKTRESFVPDLNAILAIIESPQPGETRAYIGMALKNRVPLSGQLKIKTDDGERYIYIRSEVVYDADGKPLLMVGVVRDITARNQIENVIEDVDRIVYALMNAISDIIVIVSRDFTIIDVNSVFAGTFGIAPRDMKGKNLWDFLPDSNADGIRRSKFDEVIEKKAPVRFEDVSSGIATDVILYPVKKTSGEIEMIALLGRDITEKKKQQDALRQSEQALRAVYNIPTDMIFIVDAGGSICDLNDTALHCIHKTRAEIIGCCIWTLIPRDDIRAQRIAVFNEVIQSGTFRRIRTHHPDRTAEHVIYPAECENGRVTRVVIVIRDAAAGDPVRDI